MNRKRTYFPPSTSQQRKLLFETWEEMGNVLKACQKAHVGRGTFYYWKPRFEAGLEAYTVFQQSVLSPRFLNHA